MQPPPSLLLLIILALTFSAVYSLPAGSACSFDNQCDSSCCYGLVTCATVRSLCDKTRPDGLYCGSNSFCTSGCCRDSYCSQGDNCKSSNAFLIVVGVLLGLGLIAGVVVIIWKRKSIFRKK